MSVEWKPYHQGGVYLNIGEFHAYVVPSVYERDKGKLVASVDFSDTLITDPKTFPCDGQYLYDPSKQEHLKKLAEDFLRKQAKQILRELGE